MLLNGASRCKRYGWHPRRDTTANRSDNEFIAKQFDIGTYTNKRDFENHLKVGVFEGINPSDSLTELAEKTATHDQLEEMAASTFSRRTNGRDYCAVVRVSWSCSICHNCITNAVFNANGSNGSIEQLSLSTEQISLSLGQSLFRVNCMTGKSLMRLS
ncbi:hypothetical protein [Natrinema zhouii]|uniref:hypothetical protein n=1 Tax=Natrinema zhouii TaxID=1710539 RepID=UPI003CE5173A